MAEQQPAFNVQQLSREDRHRLKQMMQSPPFRFLLDQVVVQLLEHDMMQLRNPNIPFRRHLFVQGANFRMQQFLDYCCSIAEMPPPATPRHATQLDTSRLYGASETAEPQQDPNQPTETPPPWDMSYRRGYPS